MGKKQWFEEEAFWLNYAPIMFDEAHWAEARGVAEGCCALAGLTKGSRVLDVCCGPGRISIELALCGMSVTGVDLMQAFLDAAAESAKDEGVSLTLLKEDMRSFKTDSSFDAAVNLYNSFGYCASMEEDALILRSVYEALKPGGVFILECISREIAVRYFTEGEWFVRAGKTVLTDFSVEGAWEGLRSRWILIDNADGTRIEHEFVQRLYPASVLRDLLKSIGFSLVEVFGDFSRGLYNQNARTMVLKATK